MSQRIVPRSSLQSQKGGMELVGTCPSLLAPRHSVDFLPFLISFACSSSMFLGIAFQILAPKSLFLSLLLGEPNIKTLGSLTTNLALGLPKFRALNQICPEHEILH